MSENESATSEAPDGATSESEAPEESPDDDAGADAAAEEPQPESEDDSGAGDEGAAGDGDAVAAEAGSGSKPKPKPRPKPNPVAAITLDRDRLKQQLMRTAADFDNFRRRSKREIEEARMRGKDDAVLEFLPVIDNLERAVASANDAADVASVVSGVQMVLKLFEDTAGRMGLNRVESVGARFDPAVHDAIQQLESDVHPAGSIMAEVTPGYMFGKRLIRPAMVVVARAPVAKTGEATAVEETTDAEEEPPQALASDSVAPEAPESDDGGTEETTAQSRPPAESDGDA